MRGVGEQREGVGHEANDHLDHQEGTIERQGPRQSLAAGGVRRATVPVSVAMRVATMCVSMHERTFI